MRKFVSGLAVAVTLIALNAGCSTVEPVRNVSNSPVTPLPGKQVSLTDVQNAIIKAGAGLGWRMVAVKPGLIEGTLRLRTHTAVVLISFDTRAYNINYKSSDQLNFDGKNIHRNYNSWVQNLDKRIHTEIVNI